jgi:hypothetical protein
VTAAARLVKMPFPLEFPAMSDPARSPDPVALPGPVVGTPDRVPGSARRTSTIDMAWPDGFGTPLNLVGRARDLVTTLRPGDPVVAGSASMHVLVGPGRTIQAIEVSPGRDGVEQLVGTQGGSYLRHAIDAALPGEREAATPLHLLLDDIAGTSLIAGFVWMRWRDDLRKVFARGGSNPPGGAVAAATAMFGPQSPGAQADGLAGAQEFGIRKGRVICSGLRPGGWAQTSREEGRDQGHALRPAGDISTPADSWGWHEWPEHPPMAMRRHRRIDVIPDGDLLRVNAFFRDSGWDPDGSENVVHEYTVDAEVDERSGALVAVAATPSVLPFPECPWAAPHASQLVGLPVRTFRTGVQETLTELECCTHLNDMLRCLAEVPALAATIRATS